MNEIELLNGDCFELLKGIPDGSVDAVITDPPYSCLNKSNPHATWDKTFDMAAWWTEVWRVCKRNAVVVSFGQGLFSARLMLSQEKNYRYSLVWDKVLKNGFLNAKRMPLRQHEDVLVFYRQMPIYNPQMTKCEPHKRNHSKGDLLCRQRNRCYGSFVNTPTVVSDEKYPTSIISIPKQHINGKSYHPTEKPVRLIEYLIRTYTNDGDVVLDPFMGSGTTMVACVNTGRMGIGMELMQEYYNIAVKRVNDTQSRLF